MRVWVFTVALFLGLATWGADLLDTNSIAGGGDQGTLVDAGGPDNGTVSAMEDPLPPPRP